MRRKSRLQEFEGFIKMKARFFARRPEDVEDYEQEGRITAWLALNDDPNATKSYVRQRVEWRLRDFTTRVIYKNPAESSANELFGDVLWGDNTFEE